VFENISGADAKIDSPKIFVERMMADLAASCVFGYLTGAANFSGSTIFKTVMVNDSFTKDFDSQGAPEMMKVDGVYLAGPAALLGAALPGAKPRAGLLAGSHRGHSQGHGIVYLAA
jgi:hypothetical protein